MTDTTVFHKELDLIQDIIKRMAQNSFQKAWLIAILAVMVAFEREAIFTGAGGNKGIAIMLNCFLFLPVLCFWYLDAFFLSTERLYREVYEWVVRRDPPLEPR
jgi:hypothetical protein